MRNLIEVIDQLLAVIPEDQSEIRYELNKVRTSTGYSAPEQIGFRWRCGSDVLRVGPPAKIEDFNEWQKKVIEIWSTKTYDELVAMEAVDKSL